MGWPRPVAAQPPPARPVAAARQTLDDTLRSVAELVRGRATSGRSSISIPCPTARRGWSTRCCTVQTRCTGSCGPSGHGRFLYRRSVGTAAVATTLGRHLGFDRAALRALATGGLLLDIGKIAVPVPILAKPGALEGSEQSYVRRHVERSLELVAGRDLPARALEMIAGHHERLDGSGYPHQLRGTEIPVFGRIAAIADAFDAMTLNRRLRRRDVAECGPAPARCAARREIRRCAGHRADPCHGRLSGRHGGRAGGSARWDWSAGSGRANRCSRMSSSPTTDSGQPCAEARLATVAGEAASPARAAPRT